MIACFRNSLLLLLAIGCAADAQQQKTLSDDLLPFVPESVTRFTMIRPAKIVTSDDYAEFKGIVGEDFEKILNRLTIQYFKFSLAKFEEIESIINADWITSRESNGRPYKLRQSAMLLNAINDNQDQFDLATHAVKEEIEHDDKTILALKVPLDRYKYACILNSKTIAWTKDIDSMKTLIDSRTKSTAKTKWYKHWAPMANRSYSAVLRFEENSFDRVPDPTMKGLKGLHTCVLGAEIAKDIRVNVLGICESSSKASEVIEIAKKLFPKFKLTIKSQMERNPTQTPGLLLTGDLLDRTKFDQSKNIARASSNITLNYKTLIEPLKDVYKAQGRQFAAIQLRRNALAVLNFESAFGHFPQSVYVHESGKEYSWRIAILPFLDRQDIYDRYDFTQDWNSPHNLEVTSEMPEFFRSNMDDTETTNTSFFLLTGPGGMFGGDEPMRFNKMTDGTSNTILAIEAKRDIHWTKPEDIFIDPNQPLPEFGGFHDGGFNIVRADGSISFFPENVGENFIRTMFTPNGGDIIEMELEPESKSKTDDNGK